AADEQVRKEADEKAWADAEKTGTVAAYTAYLQNFGAGAHVSEASQRIVALNEQARKAAEEKAWADAEKAGTAAAYTAYIQNFGARSSILCAYYPQESRKNDHRRLSMSTRWYTSAIIGLPIATTAPGPPAVVPRGRGGRCVGPVGHRSMPKSRGRKRKKPLSQTKGNPKQINAQKRPAVRAANLGADSPTGTINSTADGPTGIINTAAATPPVHPEMDNEIGEARVGSSRHAAWVLHVIRLDLDALPPRNRRAITIGGSFAPPSGISGGPGQSGTGTLDTGRILSKPPRPATPAG